MKTNVIKKKKKNTWSNVTKLNEMLLLVKGSELTAHSLSSVKKENQRAQHQSRTDRISEVDEIKKEPLSLSVRFRV